MALCLFYIILNMLSALDAVNFHTNTDRLSDCLVSASVRAHVSFMCQILCTSTKRALQSCLLGVMLPKTAHSQPR